MISRHWVSPHLAKVKELTDLPPPKTKGELQTFLVMVNYLSKLSPMAADVCEPLRRLTSVNAVWMWDRLYQEVNEKARLSVKEDMCVKYYDVRKPLYLETDASGVGLSPALLQVWTT